MAKAKKNQTKPMPDEAGSAPRKKASDYLDDDDFAGELDDHQDEDQAPDKLVDVNFLELVAEIGKRFEPAATFEESGLQLTTGEVVERLRTFYPVDSFGSQMVFDALKQLGFTYDDPFRDLNFRWLFK